MSFKVVWKDLRNVEHLYYERDKLAQWNSPEALPLSSRSSFEKAYYECNAPVLYSLGDVPTDIYWNNAFSYSKVKILKKVVGHNDVCRSCRQLMVIDEVVDVRSSAFEYCYPRIIKKLNLTKPTPLAYLTNLITSQLLYIRVVGPITVNADIVLTVSSFPISIESLVSIFEAFEDNTGIETQYTVTIGTAQWEKLTEEQKAIVTNKNIILAHSN